MMRNFAQYVTPPSIADIRELVKNRYKNERPIKDSVLPRILHEKILCFTRTDIKKRNGMHPNRNKIAFVVLFRR